MAKSTFFLYECSYVLQYELWACIVFSPGESEKPVVMSLPNSHNSSLNQISFSSNYKKLLYCSKSLQNSSVLPDLPSISRNTQPSGILSCCHNPLSNPSSVPYGHFILFVCLFCFAYLQVKEREEKPAAEQGLLWGIPAGETALGLKKPKVCYVTLPYVTLRLKS